MIKRITPSLLDMWRKCGEQVNRAYIKGHKIPPGIAGRRGISFHDAAEYNFRQKKETGNDEPETVLTDCARDSFIHGVKNEGVFIPKEQLSEKSRLLNDSLNDTIRGTRAFRKKIAPDVWPEEVEQWLQHEVDGVDLPLGGRIDLVDDQAAVRDFKFTKKKDQKWADMQTQPTVYMLLRRLETGESPPNFRYDLINPNKELRHQQLDTARNTEDFKTLLRMIEVFMKELKAGVFRPAPSDAWYCSPVWCGYFPTCPWINQKRVYFT